MQYQDKLSKKERIFCFLAANGSTLKAAASEAGLEVLPEGLMRLMDNSAVTEKLKDYRHTLQSSSPQEMARMGLERLAFGSVKDAIALAWMEESPTTPELEGMDLCCISEIKRPKGGGCEIKLVDRLKALEMLSSLPDTPKGGVAGLVAALEKSAGTIAEDECDSDE